MKMPSVRTYPLPSHIASFLNNPHFSLIEMSKRFATQRGGTPSASYLLLCKARQPGKKFTATSISQLSRLVLSYTNPAEKDHSVTLHTTVERDSSWSKFPTARSTMPSPEDVRPLETVPPARSEVRKAAAPELEAYTDKLDQAVNKIVDSASRIANILAPDMDEFEKKLSDIEKLISELREGAKSSRLSRTG